VSEQRRINRGRIDRKSPLSFTFNGSTFTGYAGDTLASALLANGVRIVGRSFKYHRPRGIYSAGSEEPNALVTLNRGPGRVTPNLPATTMELFDGLAASSQNHWPSLRFDAGRINDLLHPLFSAGFYYKTFMWPKSFWDKVYEPLIRRAAGLGRAPTCEDADNYACQFAFCDVLVIGGGPAGLAAALAASQTGARVILADEQSELGGTLLSDCCSSINGQASDEWLGRTISELSERDNVRLLARTTAFGAYHENFFGLCESLTDHHSTLGPNAPRQRLWRVRTKSVVLAQGAIERPLLFDANDQPGIMLAGAAQTYLNRYGVGFNDGPVVATNNDRAWLTAFDLARAAIRDIRLVESRSTVHPALLAEAARLGISVDLDSRITAAKGGPSLKSVRIASSSSGDERAVSCTELFVSGGWTPSLHLHSQSGGKIHWRSDIGAFVPAPSVASQFVAGAGNGEFGLDKALSGGAAAGRAAAADAGFMTSDSIPSYAVSTQDADYLIEPRPPAHFRRAFVDLQNDVTMDDIRQAIQEGFTSVEHIKRYTTNGMATDQGKTSNINALEVSAAALSVAPPEAGLTRFRPPFTPVTFGAIAGINRGDTFQPVRKTPIDAWAEENGAVFEPVSLWRRAFYFPLAGEDKNAAVNRECRTVRNAVGMFDASTLGKIEIVGPDAAEFLNRMYVNAWDKLKPGRCKYGVLLGEDGFIRDDGVIARISASRFHVTTTTGGAPRVLSMMEDYLQTEWPELKVWLTSITEQWAVIAINGPKSKALIAPFISGIDLDDEILPHMAFAEGEIDGVPLRLFRVSFSGERGYELNVPSCYGRQIWERLYNAGQRLGLCAYGTEAMHVLRAEKGYIIIGQDTDGTVTPADAGLSWAISKAKKDFVGKRSLSRADMSLSNRPHLVGLLTVDPSHVLDEGAQVVSQSPGHSPLGHITSSYWSETLQRSIAMALVAGGRDKIGDSVEILTNGSSSPATLTSTVFFDPKGERLNA